MKENYCYYYEQTSLVNVVHMSRKVINSLPYCKQHIPVCLNCVIIYIVLVMKQIHVKRRLITFVSTCIPRFVARSAGHDLREDVIGAVTLKMGGASGNSANNNSAKRLLTK